MTRRVITAEQKRFTGIMAAVDDAILTATPAEIAEELHALKIEPERATTTMRARIEAAVRMHTKKLSKRVERVRKSEAS